MSDKTTHKLLEQMGYIIGKVESIETHLKTQNGTVADLVQRVSRHDVIFGKIGVAITAGVFIFTLAIDFVKDWVKAKFF